MKRIPPNVVLPSDFFKKKMVQKSTKCNYPLLYSTAAFLENVVSVKVNKILCFYVKHSDLR